MIAPINNYIRMLVRENGWKTCTLFAPGQYYHLMEDIGCEVVQIVDYDKFLHIRDYEVKDCIFDEIDVKGDVIITLHGEKMYPVNRKYPNHDHVIVLDTMPHNGTCTGPEHFEGEYIEDFGRWLVVDSVIS